MYCDTFLSSCNNKDILKTLLELRRATNEHEEPPVTFIHGHDTEKFLRSTLLVMKDEEQKALEAKQRALQAKQNKIEEEEDEEEED